MKGTLEFIMAVHSAHELSKYSTCLFLLPKMYVDITVILMFTAPSSKLLSTQEQRSVLIAPDAAVNLIRVHAS